MTATSTYARNKQTTEGACGVVVNRPHWGCVSVHSFRTWTGEHTVETWCGITVTMPNAPTSDAPSDAFPATGKLTKDLITCSGCRTGSRDAMRS